MNGIAKDYIEDSSPNGECEQNFVGNRDEKFDDTENAALIGTEQQKNKSLWKSTNLRQKFLLVDIFFLEFIVSGCIAVFFAFFSRVVIERGGTVFDSALISGTATGVYTLGCFIFGIWQKKIGLRRLLYCGILGTGVFQIAFGCLDFVHDIRIFVALGVIFQALCGFGSAGYSVSVLSTIAFEYPDHISQIIGFFYTAMGCARFAGGAFGGYMYDMVGMFPPIAIWGAVLIITLPIHYCLFKEETNRETQEETEITDLKRFLLRISTIATLALLFLVSGVYAYIDVVLTVYFQSLGLSVAMTGLGSLSIGGSLALSGPIIGYLVGKRPWAITAFTIGGSIAFSGTLLVFSPGQMTAVVYIGCVLIGITGSMVMVPTFEGFLISATGGPTETYSPLYNKISGIWSGCQGAGLTLVPIVFSAIQTATKSSITTMFYSQTGILVFFALVLLFAKVLPKRV